MIGDLVCDDWTNNPECEFDGEDCCNPNSDFSHCINCECLHWDNYTLSVSDTTHPPSFGPTCKIFCPKKSTFLEIFKCITQIAGNWLELEMESVMIKLTP